MKTITALALSLITVALCTPVHAQDSGFNVGVRAAYGLPMGSADKDTDLNTLTSGSVPIQIDGNYRINSRWEAGVYFAYGAAMIADEAKDALAAMGATAIGGHRVQRVGVQGTFHFLPDAKLAPWAGVGFGYGWTRYASAKLASGKETEIGLGGFDASVSVGGSFQASPRFSVGPFASATLGQFRSHLVWIDGEDAESTRIKDTATHEWLQFGLKASFDL